MCGGRSWAWSIRVWLKVAGIVPHLRLKNGALLLEMRSVVASATFCKNRIRMSLTIPDRAHNLLVLTVDVILGSAIFSLVGQSLHFI